jgi:ABC-type lipoprotein release transport system permease subunit
MPTKLFQVVVLGIIGLFGGLIVGALFSLFTALLLQFVHNELVAGWANIPALSYWQAYGLCFVCSMLFKSSSVSSSSS